MYCLREATVALAAELDGRKTAIIVPAKAVVELLTLESTRKMAMVEWNNINCEIFIDDLQCRGEELGYGGKAAAKV
jgi:hypothetical protein